MASTLVVHHARLEKSFVDEPAHRHVEQRIAAGRRLVRRRRSLAAVGVLVTVAILGAGYAVIGGGADPSADSNIADRKDKPVKNEPTEDKQHLDDWTQAETATELRISEGTVKSHASRGLERLRTQVTRSS